jgi:hypothetical protein
MRSLQVLKALFVGSPQQIVDKILYEHRLFGHQRFMAQIDMAACPTQRLPKSSSSSQPRWRRSCDVKRPYESYSGKHRETAYLG